MLFFITEKENRINQMDPECNERFKKKFCDQVTMIRLGNIKNAG